MGVVVVVACLLALYWGLLLWGWRKDRAERAAAAARPPKPPPEAAGPGAGGFRLGSVEAYLHAQARCAVGFDFTRTVCLSVCLAVSLCPFSPGLPPPPPPPSSHTHFLSLCL